MPAVNVIYADQINKASDEFGVSAALLQGMLDLEPSGLFELPLRAQQYAKEYAARIGISDEQYNNGLIHPETNIMSAAWYLSYLYGRSPNEWAAVEVFYGIGPKGRMRMMSIASRTYEARRRQWGE